MVAAVATAKIVVALVPELEGESTWAVAASVPFGLFVGALMAAFLVRRGREVPTFGRLMVETVALAAVLTVGMSQLVIPVAWDLPRFKITILIVVSAVVLAGIASLLLKRLYWHAK
ncbi:MAG: hypothetical protein WC815_17850 [Vicinamibacterales bacterium]